VFSWITELSTYHNQSRDGNHERNVGIEHAIKDSRCDLDLVYFLNDDNILPDNICNWENLQYLSAHSADQLISAKQFRTNGEVHTIPGMCWNSLQVVKGNLFTDTGAWFIPVYILKQFNTTRWILNVDSGDSHFYTNLTLSLLNYSSRMTNNTKVVIELPHFAFNYNALHGSQWKTPSLLWDDGKLNYSLHEYRNVAHLIHNEQQGLSSNQKMNQSEITLHEHAHILYNVREAISVTEAVFVEIGVWKAATSIFMSRHPRKTNIIGIDGFVYENQYEEADKYRETLKGQGSIDLIRGDSKTSIPALKELLKKRSISILYIDGDRSVEGVISDFKLYEPLVVDGGYIAFGGFMDTANSGGVRQAVVQMIRDNQINLRKFHVIGCLPNNIAAGSLFPSDWQNITSNLFILQKCCLKD
jgi:cephalosporin hydroxylase